MPFSPPLDSQSTRPYLVRAIYEWCTDLSYTPYVAVQVDETVQVPREFVRNGEIVLNVSFEATSGLKLGNDYIEFKARFGGVSRDIMVPMGRVLAIYALENGQGMAFPVAPPVTSSEERPELLAHSRSDSKKPKLSVAAAHGITPESAGGTAAPASGRVLQLVNPAEAERIAAPAPESSSPHDNTEPPPPPSPPTAPQRPALKRIK